MKINKKNLSPDKVPGRGVKRSKSTADDRVRAVGGADFKKELADISQQELKKQLDSLFKDIDRQGEKLKKTLDRKDLLEYRRRVREFLQLIQRKYSRTRQFSSWDRRGNLKTYRVVEQIDSRLTELHRLFLEEQTESLEVLRKLDEIRGLLLDLYI